MTSILLIISGGIAAYKSLELIRLMRKSGITVRCVLTEGGAQFVTPLSVSALSGEPVYTDLWSLKDEAEMGHIRLSREADLILVAPASADIIAKMAAGMTNDLATATLLASDKPVTIVPAMNHRMWTHPATQANIETLKQRGVTVLGPVEGDMACGEYGPGRMIEPESILAALHTPDKPLSGRHAIVTSGPTYEPLDPVRFIGNRSSGKQGHAIAMALAHAGARVTLVAGPTALPAPAHPSIRTVAIETAQDMLAAVTNALPADIAICAAAVSDWRAETANTQKLKKCGTAPVLKLVENPDILAFLSKDERRRPDLVIGFALETENLIENARQKLANKGCDWIVANQSTPEQKIFGADANQVYLVSQHTVTQWPTASKSAIAERLVQHIADQLKAG